MKYLYKITFQLDGKHAGQPVQDDENELQYRQAKRGAWKRKQKKIHSEKKNICFVLQYLQFFDVRREIATFLCHYVKVSSLNNYRNIFKKNYILLCIFNYLCTSSLIISNCPIFMWHCIWSINCPKLKLFRCMNIFLRL